MHKILNTKFFKIFILLNFVLIIFAINSFYYGCSSGMFASNGSSGGCDFGEPISLVFLQSATLLFGGVYLLCNQILSFFIPSSGTVFYIILFSIMIPLGLFYVTILFYGLFKASLVVPGRHTRWLVFIIGTLISLFGILATQVAVEVEHWYKESLSLYQWTETLGSFAFEQTVKTTMFLTPYLLFLAYFCFHFLRRNNDLNTFQVK